MHCILLFLTIGVNKMLEKIAKILTQLMTGKDNKTHDVFRWLVLLSVLVAICLSIYVVVERGDKFDIQSYGLGLGSVLAAAGLALKLKENTEPGPSDKDKETQDKDKT